jgi:hypothetical protein
LISSDRRTLIFRFSAASLLFAGTTCFAETVPTQPSPGDTKPADAKPKARESSPPSQPATQAEDQIFVLGTKPRGSVAGDTQPVRTLNASDIGAYGAEDVGELIDALGPQVTSNRGQVPSLPVVLVNGKRVSGYAEVSNIPTEAIERTEIFTEELALKYGFPANQKVVNIVTYEFFNQKRAQLFFSAPSEGGRNTIGFRPSYLLIRKDTRFVANIDYSQSSALTEIERGIVQSPENAGQGPFRTLLPKSQRLAANGTVSGNVFGGTAYSLNGRFSTVERESLYGLSVAGPLQQTDSERSARVGLSLNGSRGKWRWFLTGGYDQSSNSTHSGVRGMSGTLDIARFRNTVETAEFGQSGTVLDLPAGPIFLSLNQSIERRALKSFSSNSGGPSLVLSQTRAALSANFDVPIARRDTATPAWLGNLSFNGSVKAENFSNFGTLVNLGYGLDWRLDNAVGLNVYFTDHANPPDLSLRGLPTIVTPNVRVFDYRSGQVENVSQVFGGNPNLLAEKRSSFSISGYIKPFRKKNFSLSLDYARTTTDNPVGTFPVVTALIEAAFPARFTRDSEGRLARVDNRPINFARSKQGQLRFGLNWSRRLGGAGDDNEADFFRIPPGVDPATYLQSRFPQATKVTIQTAEQGSTEAQEFDDQNNRIFLSFYHVWRLQDLVFLNRNSPALEVLQVGAFDGIGARSRHQFEFRAGVFKRGFGANLVLQWRSTAQLRVGGPASDTLRFVYRPDVDFNLFYNLGDRLEPKSPGFLKGTRLTLSVKNLIGGRTLVRDDFGLVPLNYQPAIIDPEGRVASLILRKTF